MTRDLTSVAPTEQVSKPAPRAFRPDIEGLRAVAVVLVILDHLIGWPTGGFIGVDVFFVISGFLITELLLREHGKYGSISFSNFYARRVRRIMPVAVVVLIVTVGVSFLVYFTARAQSITGDAIASLFFVENWHLIGSGTNYLQPSAAISPLQHYWSLSVEEQYYVVWPWVIVLMFIFAARRKITALTTMRLITVVLVVAVIASFFWSVYETHTRPNWSYFSTFSRAWELGIGALLAMFSQKIRRLPQGWRPIAAWVGIAGIVASCLFLNADSSFPGPWAIVPVAAAALIIGSGIGGTIRGLGVLTNPGSRFVGRISYSLYLWHFPVIVILASLVAAASWYYIPLALVLMIALSIGSFYLVEQPVRKSKWLSPKARQPGISGGARGKVLGAAAGVAIGVVAILVLVIGTDGSVEAAGSRAPALVIPFANPGEVSAAVSGALAANKWPNLNPSVATVSAADAAPELDDTAGGRHCITDPMGSSVQSVDASQAECVYGGETYDHTLVVVGDSVAASWMPAIVNASTPLRWRVIGLTYSSCPSSVVDVTELRNRSGFSQACDASRERVFDRIAELKPDMVIMSSAEASMDRLVSGATGSDAQSEWQAGTLKALQDVAGNTSQVVVVSSPPEGAAPSDCAVKLESPALCVGEISTEWHEKDSAERSAVNDAVSTGIPAKYIDTSSWFCDSSGQCPIFIGPVLVRIDQRHLTEAASESMSGLLAAELFRTPTA